MLRTLVLFAFGVWVCQADVSTPPTIRCGEIPSSIYTCLGNPRVIPDVSAQCTKSVSECERMKCIFEKSGWLTADSKVNTTAVSAYFEKYAKDHPTWSAAVERVKTDCLSGDLPAQGVYVGCPPYDVVHCTLTAFIKNVQPSQWSTSPTCEYPKQFAAGCPLCPSDCFAPLVPNGSCNACILLPRSP